MSSISAKHKRVLCSTLSVIERSIDEMISQLNFDEKITYEITPKLEKAERENLLKKLITLKEYINNFTKKYPIEKEHYSIRKILNSKKSIWAIYLEEIKSKELKKKYSIDNIPSEEYDNNLNFIIDYIKSI